MAATESRGRQLRGTLLRDAVEFSRWVTEPAKNVAPKQLLRVRLLSTFFVLMVFNTLGAALLLKNTGRNFWVILLAICAVFIAGYFISRSKYYRAALPLAVTVPVILPVVVAILQLPGVNLTTELMWLALPILAAGFILAVWQYLLVSLSYIIVITALAYSGLLEFESMGLIIIFILMITFFLTAVTVLRQKDLATIEEPLAELQLYDKKLHESEEKFSKVFQAIPEFISISRVKDGVFLEVNQNFCRLHGRTREEIIGHTGDEIGLPMKSGQRDEVIRTIQEHGAIFNRENIYNPQTDKMRATLYSADIIEIVGESCLVSVSLDITQRKRMEETLEKEAVRRRILVEQSKDGIAIVDQNGKVYEANIRFAEMLGYTPEETLKLHVWDWDHTVPQEQMAVNVKKMGGKRDRFETQFYRKDGSILYVELSTNSVQFSGQMFIFSVSRDISERKRMEKALRDSEEKFSKAFQAIPESIAISRVKDGVFVEVNNNLANSIGRTREEIIGHSGAELGIPEPPGYFFKLVKRVQEHGKISNEELLINQKNGSKTAVLFSADITEINGELCLITISTDITERKRLQESLSNEAVRRSILMEQSSDGIVILDHNGAVYETNRRFAEMIDYSQEETLKLHLWDWEYLTTGEETLEMLQTADPTGGHFETQHRRKDGSLFDVEISTNSAEFSGQKLIFCVCRDITKRKLAEKELNQAITELQLSSTQLKATNQELESFSYSVSHDLRSPLRSIDGFSQAILEDYAPKLDETGRDYLNRIRGASQKMGELIDGLLKLSRLTRGEIRCETVDLSALGQEISRRLQETNPERKAEFIIGASLKATGDPQMLRVLIENLLGNAWKFTKKVPQPLSSLTAPLLTGNRLSLSRITGQVSIWLMQTSFLGLSCVFTLWTNSPVPA
jgi:PAS domain S-box-containing protein